MNLPRRQDGQMQVGIAHPGMAALLSFFARSRALQINRLVQNAIRGIPSLKHGAAEEFPFVIAESVSPLKTNTDSRERQLQLGKIENLRLACQKIHLRVLVPGQVFSFWRQVGAPTRLRGFKKGREVREGCVIPTTGGGLCQLSGSLLQVALSADCELIERHHHSALPADVPYDPRRDATIFWNYVDLRFRSADPILFECYLTADTLVVRMRAKSPRPVAAHVEAALARSVLLRIGASCYTCFKTGCIRQCDPPEEEEVSKTAFLVAEPEAEFDEYVGRSFRRGDQFLAPGSTLARHGPELSHGELLSKRFPLFRFRKAWHLRSTVWRGGTVAKAHFHLAEVLARTYCKQVNYDVEHVCVAQTLLPHLWKAGLLGGRSFDVLMYRLPVKELEEQLERASAICSHSRTLGEFRAPRWFAEAEVQALKAARRIVTPHPQIAALFGNAVRLAWKLPSGQTEVRGDRGEKDLVVFFGPTIARKGAYAVRDIVRQLGFELTVVGSELEGPDFWRGIRVKRVDWEHLPWHRIHTVLQPALFEFWPRHLLRAQAAGSRLLISPCCGIEEDRENGVYHVPFGETAPAVAILESLLATRGETLCV